MSEFKSIDYIIETEGKRYCVFLTPVKSNSYFAVLMEDKETKCKKLDEVLFVAREAVMEEPEKFGVVCNENNCGNCSYFKEYEKRFKS